MFIRNIHCFINTRSSWANVYDFLVVVHECLIWRWKSVTLELYYPPYCLTNQHEVFLHLWCFAQCNTIVIEDNYSLILSQETTMLNIFDMIPWEYLKYWIILWLFFSVKSPWFPRRIVYSSIFCVWKKWRTCCKLSIKSWIWWWWQLKSSVSSFYSIRVV